MINEEDLAVTWWDFAHSGRVPAIVLVAVWTLNKDGTVAQTLCKYLPPNVVQPHTSSWRAYRNTTQAADYMKHKYKKKGR